MGPFNRQIEISLVAFMFLFGCAFLLRMCYLSLVFNTLFILAYLTVLYLYLRLRYEVTIPWFLLLCVFAAVEVDALGNFFRLYGQRFGPMQYDEFSHMTVQVLVTPIVVWLIQRALQKLNHQFSLRLISLLSASVMFSLASFYEIIELWDDLYFRGTRIWGRYDTAIDLQWDLCGIAVGTVVANLALKRYPRITQNNAEGVG